MKLTYCIIALALAVTAGSARAALSPEIDLGYHEGKCDLSPTQAARRDAQVAKITRRLQFAAAEAMDHPEFYEQVERETHAALRRLGRVYGTNCVISLR